MTTSAPPENLYVRSLVTMKETTKWIFAGYGAIGAALIAGLQLTGIGSFDSFSLRGLTAVAGYLVAIGAIVKTISGAARVFVAPVISLSEFNSTCMDSRTDHGRSLKHKEDLIKKWGLLTGTGFQTIESLVSGRIDAHNRHSSLRKQIHDENVRLRHGLPDADDNDAVLKYNAQVTQQEALRKEADVVAQEIEAGRITSEQIRDALEYLETKERFDDTIGMTKFAGIAVALGALAFAWGVHKVTSPSHASEFRTPVLANLNLSREGREIKVQLGTSCEANIPVIALSGKPEDGFDVVVLPSDNCLLARTYIPATVGTLSPIERIPLVQKQAQ